MKEILAGTVIMTVLLVVGAYLTIRLWIEGREPQPGW
jgi:hypothetical protein